MKNKIILTVIVLMIIVLVAFHYTAKTEEIKPIIMSQNSVGLPDSHIELAKEKSYYWENNREKLLKSDDTQVSQRPYIPNIPLTDQELEYIWNVSQQYNVPYELVLGVMKLESEGFKRGLVSSTDDYGIMQIHKPTARFIAKELGYKQYNLMDVKTNILFGVWYLNYLQNYWKQYNLSDEEMFFVVTYGYNHGITQTRRHLKQYGYNHSSYVNVVLKYKEQFEQEEEAK